MTVLSKPKILILDIETSPATAYVWGLFKQNISINQLIESSRPICFAAKWYGERGIRFHSDWTDGHDGMIRAAHELISEADAVVGYNSDRFDLPKLQGEFLLAGLAPPPPVTGIDLLKTVKKLGLQSNKLAYVCPHLGLSAKVSHEGFSLWPKAIAGDAQARKKMREYNLGDVELTEQLYELIKPYIRNHPHLNETTKDECGACGSSDTHKRGFRRTKAFKIQRIQCNSCGSWSDGVRSKVG